MATNKENYQKVSQELIQLQERNPEMDIFPILQPMFCISFWDPETDQPLEKDLDIDIIGINLTIDEDQQVAYWNIILCGSDSRVYAQHLQEDSDGFEVLIHDLQGTRQGRELFQITIIAG